MSKQYALCGIVLFLVYLLFSTNLGLQRKQTKEPIGVVLPFAADLTMHTGDRFLAANISYLKTLAFAFEDNSASISYRAKLHQRVAELNPMHEDNFFTSTAVLPWEGEVDTAQNILALAKQYRPWDSMPALFQGLNELYFNADITKAGELIKHAANLEQGSNKAYFQRLAAFLQNKAGDHTIALAYANLIKKYISSPLAKVRLNAQIKRLENLVLLQKSYQQYHKLRGSEPKQLSDFIDAQLLDELPVDPMGKQYAIDNGKLTVLE